MSDDKLKPPMAAVAAEPAASPDDQTFMNAQLAFAKSKHGKAAKRNKAWYTNNWHKKGGNNE